MPGPVIQGHAKLEAACENCHVRFDRTAQNRLCLDCHKPVRADVEAGSGYHGRLKERAKECRTCHTEHKGRGARIAPLEEKAFDHGLTDFALHGRHKQKACNSCHRAGTKFRQAPTTCDSCHREKDKHKGGLGAKCGNCHGEDNWKEARFDHAKTKFPLKQSHAASTLKCEGCHVDQKYTDTPRQCVSCHRDDDMKKGHKGRFGNRCETCHDEGEWKTPSFRHDRDTRYPLLDRHRVVKCETCHLAPLYREKTSTRCVTCHRRDDIHKDGLGDKCDKCHSAKGWKTSRFDHTADTRFALRDKHASAKCDACHKDKGMVAKVSMVCYSCHEKDDRQKGHKGRYGEKCETCHNAKAFKPATFDHGRDTTFPLGGKHDKITCDTCHREALYRTKMGKECYTCHKKDDIHFETYGLDCQRCHVADNWRKVNKKEAALVVPSPVVVPVVPPAVRPAP